jgi:beta-galactosidase/beta-glucuronidase
LALSGTPRVVNVQAVPELEGKSVRVVAEIEGVGAQPDSRVVCRVREAVSGKLAGEVETPLPTGQKVRKIDVRVPIRDCRFWSPESPFLYELEVSTGADALPTRFGMRSFRLDAKTGRAVLNGKPYSLRGTNVCVYRFFEDPARGDRPWRAEWVRRLHRAFRSMNWNSIRYCIGFPPELWYRIADEEGLMIQDEFPIWQGGQWPAELKSDAIIKEYTEWMRERWNHPCVVIWDAQNESVTTETGKAIKTLRQLDLSNRPGTTATGSRRVRPTAMKRIRMLLAIPRFSLRSSPNGRAPRGSPASLAATYFSTRPRTR